MEANNNSKKLEKYGKDIETIKSLLMQVEEKPLVEHWAFYSWGILFFMGTLLHYFTAKYMQFTIQDAFLKVWLPIVLIAIFLETIAWIRKMTKESIPLFSRSTIKLWLSVIGSFIGACVIIIVHIQINAAGTIPVIMLILFAIILLMYAQAAYIYLYIHAYFMLIVSIILYPVDIATPIKFLISGSTISFTLITVGITSWLMEKKNAER